jgi:hypothetical protein
MSMSCVPEGGMHYDWDLTYIIDGVYPSIRVTFLFFLPFGSLLLRNDHAISIPTFTLYAFSGTGTGSTPTLLLTMVA